MKYKKLHFCKRSGHKQIPVRRHHNYFVEERCALKVRNIVFQEDSAKKLECM